MKIRYSLPMTVVTVLSLAVFGSAAQAEDDGVAFVGGAQAAGQPFYVVAPSHQRQPPNPTYWTWMPCPFHGTCDYCADTNCPGGKGMWVPPAVRWALDPDYYAVSPDYGWSPPAKHAIPRQNVTYQKYYPTTLGTARRTRTGRWLRSGIRSSRRRPTRLRWGYNYQHVPTWQRTNILPNPPHPQRRARVTASRCGRKLHPLEAAGRRLRPVGSDSD